MVGPIDPRERDAMARLMNIVANGPDARQAPAAAASEASPQPASHGHPGAAAMKHILQRFYGATDNAARTLNNDAQYSREVKRALITERTEHGAKIGSWEIRAKPINEKLKTYDVCHVQTGENIATELRLYEAAHALVKLLNNGVGINTKHVREVLGIEEDYCKHYQDAVSFRQKMQRMSTLHESFKMAVAEDRYNEARSRALAARDRLRKLDREL